MRRQSKNTKNTKSLLSRFRFLLAAVGVFILSIGSGLALSSPAYAANEELKTPTVTGKYKCGSGLNAVEISINIGCYGESGRCASTHGCSALLDATFAIIRFLSAGVGIVVVGSVIWAGIQYTTSRGDPSATAKAIERLRSTGLALVIFIFGYAILNFLIPAGFFK